MKLVSYTIKHPITIAMFTAIALVLGIVSYIKLPIDLMPDISFPIITIQTDYEGVTPREIETLITKPIEEAISGVENIDSVSSYSYEGRSLVRIHFNWGQDLDGVASDLRDRLSRIRERLPDDASSPILLKFDINAIPIMWVGVKGNITYKDLKHFAEKSIKNSLERIKGVAQAQVSGGLEREIHIYLRYSILQTLGISIDEVIRAIKQSNVDITVGEITKPKTRYLIRTPGKFKSIDEISSIVVKRTNNSNVTIANIASVYDSFKEVKTFVRVNGQNAVVLRVIKQSDANTVSTANAISKELQKLRKNPSIIQKGVSLQVTRDTSVYIKRSISNVRQALLFGGIIALVVLLLFIRNIKSTLLIAISMIVSTISTFIFVEGFDLTLNIMTFGGLALGIGMLVDNSVVVIENIARHHSINSKDASFTGTNEVIKAIYTSTITTMVVFLPMFFLEGITGILFGQLALMVSFSLFASLIIALTLIPAFAKHSFYKKRNFIMLTTVSNGIGLLLDKLSLSYARALKAALNNKIKLILSFILALLLSLLLITFIGFNFMAETDEGEVRINGDMTIGTNIETTSARFKEIESILQTKFKDEIDIMYTRIGQAGWRRPQEHSGYINIYLQGKNKRKRSSQEIAIAMNKTLTDELKDIKLRVRASSFFIFRYMKGGAERIQIQVLGHNLDKANKLADKIIEKLRGVKGVSYLKKSVDKGEPQYAINIDRRRTKELGLSVEEVGRFLQNAILGNVVSYFSDGEDEYPIRVSIDPKEIRNISAIKNLKYHTKDNKKIFMKSIIKDIEEEKSPSVIERLNQERVIYIYGGIGKRDTGAILKDIRASMLSIDIPDRISIHYGGVFEEQDKAYSELMLGIIMAFILVYMIIAAQFESLKAPFVIMFTVPFSFTGVILIFYLLDYSFDIQSFIGSIMLTGIVVNNAIVLVDFIERGKKETNADLKDIIIDAGGKRLRPILITSLTTILALVPLAIGFGEGSETQVPIALTVIGGLSYSIFVSLFLIPCIYLLFFKKRPPNTLYKEESEEQ